MAQPDLNITTALEAIAEGLNILQLLACATDKTRWIDDSVPLSKLNELAQSLGYRDAQSVHSQVEHDRDLDECYAKIRQLRAGLVQAHKELAAVGEALDVEKSAHRGSVLIADDVINEMRQEIKQLQTDSKLNAEVLAQLVTSELAALLEQLATHVPYTLHTGIGIATQARALAARIREALEASDES